MFHNLCNGYSNGLCVLFLVLIFLFLFTLARLTTKAKVVTEVEYLNRQKVSFEYLNTLSISVLLFL